MKIKNIKYVRNNYGMIVDVNVTLSVSCAQISVLIYCIFIYLCTFCTIR